LELGMMEMVLITGAVRPAELQSNHHHQQTNTQFFTGRMTFLSPNNSVRALKGKALKKNLSIFSLIEIFSAVVWHYLVG